MPSDTLRRAAPFAALAALLFFYLFSLNGVGILSTDEPRYAAIGAAMAESGDWVTPRLWGTPWFEKSPLLYWMTAAATRLGIAGEAAARGPVALASVAFLVWLWLWVRRQFGELEAWLVCLTLSTSVGWISYSFAAVTDLPMSITLAVAVLLSVEAKPDNRSAFWIGFWLGLAVLAKGLVPLVLFAPLCWPARRKLFPIGAGCVLVAAPWYVACYAANGQVFLSEFIWKHHVQRFFSDSLQHVQPFWFYVPVLLAGFFPWTPLLFTLRRWCLDDHRLRWIALWTVGGIFFFSVSKNKLPGYVLPLMPGIAVLAGIAAARAKRVTMIVCASAALLLLLPAIGMLLPEALRSGIRRAGVDWHVLFGLPAALISVVVLASSWLVSSGRRGVAVALVAVSAAVGVTMLKVSVFPILDEQVTVRQEFRRLSVPADQVCAGEIHRARLYGFSYYFRQAIPDCEEVAPRPVVLTNEPVR